MVARTRTLTGDTEGQKDSLLRRGLIGDSLFCGIAGAAMIAGTNRISEFTGLNPSWVPAAIGAGLLLWAVEVGYMARKRELSQGFGRFVIGANLAWIVASYGVLIAGVPDLTTPGKWTVGILAEVVALLTVVQYLGLRRMRSWM